MHSYTGHCNVLVVCLHCVCVFANVKTPVDHIRTHKQCIYLITVAYYCIACSQTTVDCIYTGTNRQTDRHKCTHTYTHTCTRTHTRMHTESFSTKSSSNTRCTCDRVTNFTQHFSTHTSSYYHHTTEAICSRQW